MSNGIFAILDPASVQIMNGDKCKVKSCDLINVLLKIAFLKRQSSNLQKKGSYGGSNNSFLSLTVGNESLC